MAILPFHLNLCKRSIVEKALTIEGRFLSKSDFDLIDVGGLLLSHLACLRPPIEFKTNSSFSLTISSRISTQWRPLPQAYGTGTTIRWETPGLVKSNRKPASLLVAYRDMLDLSGGCASPTRHPNENPDAMRVVLVAVVCRHRS